MPEREIIGNRSLHLQVHLDTRVRLTQEHVKQAKPISLNQDPPTPFVLHLLFVPSWPLFPLPIAPCLEPHSAQLLQQPASTPSPDLAVSNSPNRTPPCLALSRQGVIPTSSSKRKARLMRSPPLSIGKGAGRRTRTTTLRQLASSRNPLNRAHLSVAVALAQEGENRGNQDWGQNGEKVQRKRGRMEGVGGGIWRRNMAVWNWRIRAVLLEITLLLVCPDLRFLLLISRCSYQEFGAC